MNFINNPDFPQIKSIDDVNIIKAYFKEIDAAKLRIQSENAGIKDIKKNLKEEYELDTATINLISAWYQKIGENKKGEDIQNVERSDGLFTQLFHE